MPNVQLIRATFKDHDILFNLAQLYQYDFTEYLPGDLDEEGYYPYISVRYYLNKGRQAYLARVDEHLAGFVLVDETTPHKGAPGRYIAEFFVLRRYRRQGIGKALAFQTFDTYKGYWEIAEVGPNLPAQAFWRAIIAQYAHGRFQEVTTEEDGLKIVWQMFDSREW
jgi:predicted acetyltransferase